MSVEKLDLPFGSLASTNNYTIYYLESVKTLTFDPPLEYVTGVDFSKANGGRAAKMYRSGTTSKSCSLHMKFWNGSTKVKQLNLNPSSGTEQPVSPSSFTDLEPFTLTKITFEPYSYSGFSKPIVTWTKTSTFTVTVERPPLEVNMRSISALATVQDAGVAKLTYEGPDGEEHDVETVDSQSVYHVVSLLPETEYTFRLYQGSEVLKTITATTLEDTVENYVKSDYFDGKRYQLKDLSKLARGKMSRKMNDVFDTGDVLRIKDKKGDEVDAKFVKRGETITGGGVNVVVPFVETDGPGQKFYLSTDQNTTQIDYSESSNTISINSTEYGVGDSFVLDNNKYTVAEYDDDV